MDLTSPAALAASQRLRLRSAMILAIFLLLLLHALKFAAAIVVPVVLALLTSLVLSPVVDRLRRIAIPRPVGAMAAVLGLIALLIAALSFLTDPALEWFRQIPTALDRAERHVSDLITPISDLERVAEKVGQITDSDVVKVEQGRSMSTWLLSVGPTTIAGTLAVFVLIYFMLASGDRFLRVLVEQIPQLSAKKGAVRAVQQIRTSLSMYLYTISVINLCLGVATTVVLALIGVPNAALWGAIAGLLNFAPYVGALTTIAILALVGVITFDTLTLALLPPLSFLVLTTLEAQIVTPNLVGRHLELEPVMILLALLLLGWLWGVAGFLLAVPVLAAVKLTCEQFEATRVVAAFLQRRHHHRRRLPLRAAKMTSPA